MNGAAGDDLHALAGEYVIGTLDATERMAFAESLQQDPDARRAVGEWEWRFAALAAFGDEVAPAPLTWNRIAASLPSERTPTQVAPGADADRVDRGGDLLRAALASRTRWRAATFASGSLAAALLVGVLILDRRPIAGEHRFLVAAVNRDGDRPALLIRVDLAARRVVVRPVAAVAPAGRSLELWAVNANTAPRSLGLVPATPADYAMPADAGANTSFAVSVEPVGGSKTGGPTGPVIYAGQLIEE